MATVLFGCMGLLFGIGSVGLSMTPSYEIAALAVFFVGLGFGGFMTLNGALIVRSTDPLFFGRVMSLTMLAFCGFGLMALPIGVVADAIGERGALAVLGLVVCAMVCGFALLTSRSRPAEGVSLREGWRVSRLGRRSSERQGPTARNRASPAWYSRPANEW